MLLLFKNYNYTATTHVLQFLEIWRPFWLRFRVLCHEPPSFIVI